MRSIIASLEIDIQWIYALQVHGFMRDGSSEIQDLETTVVIRGAVYLDPAEGLISQRVDGSAAGDSAPRTAPGSNDSGALHSVGQMPRDPVGTGPSIANKPGSGKLAAVGMNQQ